MRVRSWSEKLATVAPLSGIGADAGAEAGAEGAEAGVGVTGWASNTATITARGVPSGRVYPRARAMLSNSVVVSSP